MAFRRPLTELHDMISVMPNGVDVNWVKVCAAIDGFRMRYDRWPTRIRAPEILIDDVKQLFAEADFLTIREQIQFVIDDLPIVAEDDDGNRFSYGEEGPPQEVPELRTIDWFKRKLAHTATGRKLVEAMVANLNRNVLKKRDP